MSYIYQARYDSDVSGCAREFMKKYDIEILWECRENPGNTGENIHYHAILKSDKKLTSIKKYRTDSKMVPGGQGSMTLGEVENIDNFKNYIHKGEYVQETGTGQNKKYIDHTRSRPFITITPGFTRTDEDHHNKYYIYEKNKNSDDYYHDEFWNYMHEHNRVIKIEKDKDGNHTVHKKGQTGNTEFLNYMVKQTCYKTVDNKYLINENMSMDTLTEKIVSYYRLEKKDFSDIVLQNKMNLYYATVVRKTDPDTYNQWIKSKSQMLKDKGFICPKNNKDKCHKKEKVRIESLEDFLED